jgi:rhamnosyltransferase
MYHKAGDPQIKKFCGLLLKSSNHNSFRRYYMARNHVLLSKEYFFKFPYFILKLNYFFFLSLIKILLIEEEKKSKLISSMKGLKDGIFYSSNKKIYNEQSIND